MRIEQEFVEYIVKGLVDQPDDVRVERTVDDRGILLVLRVADDDLGRVIGKGGSIAQSLRVLLRALGNKNEERYNLRIADGTNEDGPPNRSRSNDRESEPEVESDEAEMSEPAPETEAEPEPAPEAEESELDKVKNELADLDDLEI